jgi:hypothetical protein
MVHVFSSQPRISYFATLLSVRKGQEVITIHHICTNYHEAVSRIRSYVNSEIRLHSTKSQNKSRIE